MHHPVVIPLSQQPIHPWAIIEADLLKARATRNQGAMPVTQVVHNDNVVTLIHQQLSNRAANIPCSACYKNLQTSPVLPACLPSKVS